MRGAVFARRAKAFLFQQVRLMTLRVDASHTKNSVSFRLLPCLSVIPFPDKAQRSQLHRIEA
jgi:hypothetical protein